VLYQLSYAPRLPEDCIGAPGGITRRVRTPQNDNPETSRQAEDDLLAQQEGKGYGEDEGEREGALDDAGRDEQGDE
jgi:hypothetical protein